jgi:hypothetical protein
VGVQKMSNEIQTSKLYQCIKSQKYKSLIDEIRPALDKLYKEVNKLFPEYTPHDYDHISTVIINIGLVLDNLLDSLSQEQLFCLIPIYSKI